MARSALCRSSLCLDFLPCIYPLSTRLAPASDLAACVQEPGRMFCPACGNATLDKVEVVTGPDGAQCFGVRRRHNLRGTRFSLPKPKVCFCVLC